MKRLVFLMALLGTSCLNIAVNAAPASTKTNTEHLLWQTNYEVAALESKEENKPMILLFTGSDWCSWCVRLEKEVFDSPEFAEKAGNKFVFVKLDFPVKQKLTQELAKQNQALKAQYQISGFPTVVILSSKQELIGTSGYEAGGGEKYAEKLLDMVNKKSK